MVVSRKVADLHRYADFTERERTPEIRRSGDHDFSNDEGSLFAVSIDNILNIEQPEEARGPGVDNAGDDFIWNQMDYHGDESNDANDSRSGVL
ncbi:hypothetical protein INT43_002444 [Umbelopsis isabellina]|uniref:Uncharacterized protein n=1 Tax=Mortierella isabellina TaxID=91625 RepID=A0A8H7UHH4_MORIS|nr:hypothetical protein INT43_002444 [Umbelopsis isabellina]